MLLVPNMFKNNSGPIILKRMLIGIISCSVFLFFISCNGNEKPKVISPADKVTYERDVKPILVKSCTPCHFDGGINKNKWDDYATTKYKIPIIIDRVNKEQGAAKFMPKDGHKLSPETIAILRKWVTDGTLEQ